MMRRWTSSGNGVCEPCRRRLRGSTLGLRIVWQADDFPLQPEAQTAEHRLGAAKLAAKIPAGLELRK